MKILIFVNVKKDTSMTFANGLCKIMDAKNVEYDVFTSECDSEKINSEYLLNINAVIVLGGDGTMLHAIREVSKKEVPVLGVNIGHLGFLTAIEYNNFENAMNRIIKGDYFIEDRILLQSVNSKGEYDIAVNDICILSKEQGKIIGLSVKINGRMVEEFKGDGIIISSPTGSTGYSLSAGGPIVSPMANCIILTPICAHSLTTKPIVLCDCDKVSVQVTNDNTGMAIWDGQSTKEVQYLTVEKSVFKARFIRFKDYNFFDVLSQKFNHNKR
ncbi:MAG: NAD(+)/NADH kinase [Lachnospiraceae bacterium]|nr:NAD(+)/NADH kinase [Lachnospiraceae bacterium]